MKKNIELNFQFEIIIFVWKIDLRAAKYSIIYS